MLPTPPGKSPLRQGTTDSCQVRDLRTFTLLETILSEVQDQKSLLKQVCRKINAKDDKFTCGTTLPDDISFPLQSVEEVKTLDASLEDENTRKAVFSYLSIFGGDSVKKCVRRLRRETVSDTAAQEYNMLGQKHKHSFGKLKLMPLYFKCLQKKSAYKECNYERHGNAIKDWLRGAKDRASHKFKKKL